MFNIGFSELLVVGVIALIFIGPEQLPDVARTIGRMLNELRRATDDLRGGFTNDIRETIARVKEDIPPRVPDKNHEPSPPPREDHPPEPRV